MTQSQVIRTIEIRSPPSKVWRHIGTQEGLRRWIAPSLDIEMKVGGKYRFLGPDNKTTVSGTVLELVPEGWLVLSWMEEGQGWTHPARFVIALEACATGTKVTVIHDGFAATGQDWEAMVGDYEMGASAHKILEKLAALVDADAG